MRRGVFITFVVSACTLAGCGAFDTRVPENPVNSGSGNEPATTPTIVLRNLENALNYANASDYRKCFADTTRGMYGYSFHASSQGMSAAPSQFANWGIAQEEEYIRNVFAELRDGAAASVIFTPSDVTTPQIGDSVHFTADYLVRFPHTRVGAEVEAAGTIALTFRQSRQNEWFITDWRDVSRSDKTSWSLIKARFIDR